MLRPLGSPDKHPVGDAVLVETVPEPAKPELNPQAEPQLQHAQQPAQPGSKNPCCKCGSTGKRNLVVCIDGTSNQFSTKNTNVVELYSRLVKDGSQRTFYNSGIGTYAKPSWKSWSYRKQVIANKLDLAFALRFEKIIISAYAWLVDNYRPGDRIFLFGFSRGAYQVRALAAMIDTVGLLHKGNNDQIPFAYELYTASGDEKPGSSGVRRKAWRDVRPLRERLSQAWRARSGNDDDETKKPTYPWPKPTDSAHVNRADEDIAMHTQFKNTFSRAGVRVHFVGAWDTVSSVGLVRDKTLPSTTDGMQSVCFFRHALALHEFRVKFLPEYADGGTGPTLESVFPTSGEEPHTKEVWFSGSHSDIGGGSTANTSLNKFGPALRWMSWEATLAGLKLVETPDSWEAIGVSKSMTMVWRIVECLPIKRLSYPRHEPRWQEDGPVEQSFTWLPHFFARRRIQPRQRIHQSVYEECFEFKAPEHVLQEPDAYLVLRPQEDVMRHRRILTEQSMRSLQQLLSSEDGIQSLEHLNVTQYIYDIARLCCGTKEATEQIMDDLDRLQTAYVKGSFQTRQGMDLPHSFFDCTDSATSETFPFRMCGHTSGVTSLTFSSDSRVVSGSYDDTIRVWDVRSGEMTLDGPLSSHDGAVNCVARLSAGSLVASASNDSTIRLWAFDSNGAVHAGKVLRSERMVGVHAVAFSPDGSYLVSGSTDGALRVWNIITGERMGEPVRGHTDQVLSVAFSPDGGRVVSGSVDRTVRLWEWSPADATLRALGEPLHGQAGWVRSVAFSPDARLIASGSDDRTVRLWDANTRTPKFTLEGHTGPVTSLAFAPSGKHVASASLDWTVRIWDAQTGAAVRVLRGHTASVVSVAFSPGGKRVASGSGDMTVRVWEFHPGPDGSHQDDVRALEQTESM
ncbi:WD40 repeat-like protein [Auricularia subglabra TFB-10046 SS5]|nr:WD40 repeat-like protein [Auricularia subglabra TFB-10046 SS5]